MKRYGIKFYIRTKGGLLLEQLRYAQILSYQENVDEYVVTIWSPLPKGSNHEQWQKNNIERMKSFGIKAEPV